MSHDHQLQNAAQAMVAAAEKGKPVIPVMKKLCPHICRQIVADSKYPDLLSMWGRSVNVDENVGQIIVHPAILRATGELAGVPMRGMVVHAGLQHTYGYLFSLIETPYGAKRDRWVSTDLERGFGIDLSLLGDRPRRGTLLANLTWFLGKIVFRDQSAALSRLARNALAVAPALVNLDYAHLSACRILEKAVLSGTNRREVSLITDLVPYPHPPANPNADNVLLVYSIQNGARSTIKLITGFSVKDQVAQEIRASVDSNEKVPIRLRYNAYVPGIYGRTAPGRRFFSAKTC
jgi:hypothetical protein